MIQIRHKQNECIGCAQCVELAPDHWILDADGMAQLVEETGRGSGFALGQGFEPDRAVLALAEQSCPVNIIELT